MSEHPQDGGRIIIEWPAPAGGRLPGRMTSIYDADSGDLIPVITEMTIVHASAEDVIYAEAVVLTDPRTSADTERRRFLVTEMRIASPILPVPVDEPTEGWPEPRRWEHPIGGIQMPAGPSA